MERRIILWIVIGALFLVALYFIFQAGSSSVIQGAVSSTGQAASSGVSSGGMVGGC